MLFVVFAGGGTHGVAAKAPLLVKRAAADGLFDRVL